LSRFIKIFLITLFVLSLTNEAISMREESAALTLEIFSENDVEQVIFHSKDIKKVGINDRMGITKIEIIIIDKYHEMLENLTKNNLGKHYIIKSRMQTLASGPIRSSIKQGYISFFSLSKEKAEQTIKKLGFNIDYYLGPTPEELEDAKIYVDSNKNSWANKAIDVQRNREYKKAEEYAKKAIESEPDKPLHYATLSMIYHIQGKNDLALEQLLKAEEIIENENISKYPGIYLGIGGAYAEQGRFTKAIETYQKFLSADKSNLNVHLEFRDVPRIYGFVLFQKLLLVRLDYLPSSHP